jgi:hypothetical protein
MTFGPIIESESTEGETEMSEAPIDKSSGAVGDLYRPLPIPESEQEELVTYYVEKAKEEQGAIVGLLSQALGVVLKDLYNDSLESLIDMVWLPASHLDEIGIGEGQGRSAEHEGWGGIAYLCGRRWLVINIEPSYLEDYREQLPFFLAQSIQDSIIEEVREARPACPVHGHPLNPAATPTGSLWQCPEGPDVWSCAMGSYHEAAGSRSG